jgi:hypothetical protein
MFKEILATYLFTRLLGKERARKLGMALQKYTIKAGAIVFGFVAIAHSIRFAFGIDAIVAGWVVPVWFSFVGAIVAGYFAFSLWKMK